MSSETSRSLSHYITLIRGTTYKGNLVGAPGPALLGLGAIEPGGGFRETDFKTYGGECPEKLMLFPGDLFAALKGATKDGKMIGSVARVPKTVAVGRLTQDTVKLEFIESHKATRTYIYWLLQTPQYREYCAGRAMGSAVVALSREDFLSYPIPPLTAQRAHIVDLLEEIEHRCRVLRETNVTLEAIAQALFKSWFVDFEPVRAKQDGRALSGMDEATAALFPERFEETKIGVMPTGWQLRSVYELATYINGAAYKAFEPNGERRGLPIIKIAELKSGVTEQTAYSDVSMPEKCRIRLGDILFSWSGNPDTSIDTFVWHREEAWLNQHIFRVLPHRTQERAFVLQLLRHLRPTFAELARNKQTTGLGHVTVADMKRLMVVCPDEKLIELFNECVGSIHAAIFENQRRADVLSELRATLLPRLISGQLRLPEAEALVA